MNYIFLDFEMNYVGKEFAEIRSKWRHEIIEIGAVMMTEQLEMISSFKSYVKPEFCSGIDDIITNLTGITDEDVAGAPELKHVLGDFADWCMSEGSDYKIYAWSNSDLLQLTHEMEIKSIPVSKKVADMKEHWFDFQKEFGVMMHAKNAIGLASALDTIGINFEGSKHDALWDATNTAILFQATKTSETFARMKKLLDDSTKPAERLTSSFGSLFDFDKLVLKDA